MDCQGLGLIQTLVWMYNTLFLAGGYGTRFQRQVPPDSPLAKLPKGLLPLNGKSLLSLWMDLGVQNVFIITNDVYFKAYQEYSREILAVFSNKSNANDNRLGSIGDLHLAIQQFHLYSTPLLVIASDIYFPGFDLNGFIDYCCLRQEVTVLYYKIKDENVSKSGIIEMDEASSQIVKFLEKPLISDTNSRLGCPCFYYFPPSALGLIDLFMQETEGELDKVDASGKLIQWLILKTKVYGYPLDNPKLDIGDYQSYLDAERILSSPH